MKNEDNTHLNELFKDFFEGTSPSKEQQVSSEKPITPPVHVPKNGVVSGNDSSHLTQQKTQSIHQSQLTPLNANTIEGGNADYIENPPLDIAHSSEVDEILSYVPNWMIRWGISAFLGILLGVLVLSYFIKYPDIIPGQITITTTNPPATVVSKANGSIQLFHPDKSILKTGDIIALIKNSTNYDDILQLKTILQKLETKLSKSRNLRDMELPSMLSLGNLQGTYSNLVFHLKEFQLQYQKKKNDKKRKSSIDYQIDEMRAIERDYAQQVRNQKEEYLKAKKKIDQRYAPLYKNGSISAEQLEQKQSEVTQKFNAYQSAQASQREYRKRILDMSSQKNELDYTYDQNTSSNLHTLSAAYSKMVDEINVWENQFILKAPIDGRLNYLHFIKNNLHIKPEQEIATIAPMLQEDSIAQVLQGELYISGAGLGKVEVGQIVNVELDAYPKKEYGLLEGKINSVADVGTTIMGTETPQTLYKLDVSFEDALTTTVGKKIDFKPNLGGKAEVITEDIRFIERIFYEMRAIFK